MTITLPPAPVIDSRVRLPPAERPDDGADAEQLFGQYDAVLGVFENSAATTLELLAQMDRARVERAIVHAEYEYGDVADALNDAVARCVAADPTRLQGFGTVSLERASVRRMVQQVERIAELGLLGVNLQPVFFDMAIDDRRLYPVYAKAEELSLTVAVHTGVNYSRRHPIADERPILLDRVACDFQALVLVACHGGWPWVAEMVAVARRHPTVHLDFGGMAPKYVTAPGSGWEVLARYLTGPLRDQVLFASDWPVFPIDRAVHEWTESGIRPEALTALLGGNANRLWPTAAIRAAL
jgi:predicted TIM-barrel fold metal-dependent hydrolase